jgi:hypothetical protein
MARRDPPTITAVTLSPDEISDGTTITAMVTWTGYSAGAAIRYQWRTGDTDIRDETGVTYAVPEAVEGINVFVRIDNGRGTAAAASLSATIAVEDTGPIAFSSGFSGGFL